MIGLVHAVLQGEHSLINTRAALLQAIKTSARDGKGLHIREIRDSWPGVVAEIDQLEKEGRIFATRTTKDNQPKTIFWNEMTEEEGGRPVDKGILSYWLRPLSFAPSYNLSLEFQDIWNNLKVPPEADLLKSLATDGLQAAIAAPASGALPGNGKKKGKKSAHRIRQAKITNTHLEGIDVSKAYKPAEQN